MSEQDNRTNMDINDDVNHTAANREIEYRDWLPKNKVKKSVDIYVEKLEEVKNEMPETLSPYSSFFEISDVSFLNEVISKIKGHEKYGSYDKRNRSNLNSYLNKYRNFLIYLNESDKNMKEKNQNKIVSSSRDKADLRNLIYFGAPGTGKSYTLNEDKKELLGEDEDDNYERVTFHPDYSYAHFVGTYKPVPKDDGITYSYVPGPFMRTYVKAVNELNEARKNSAEPKPILLVIEEINRANVAAVFGDIFQLLDRDETGKSVYPIHASEDIKEYLESNLDANSEENCSTLCIPANMYIWATMNSADQGVFPMDTAFKRRWDFIYRGINEGDNKEVFKSTITLGKEQHTIVWNDLRKAINKKLLEFNVNEDKLMGPYFIQPNISQEEFIKVFKNKVIMYLFDDAAKLRRGDLFSGCKDDAWKQYSEICREFDQKGVYIFCKGIIDNLFKSTEG